MEFSSLVFAPDTQVMPMPENEPQRALYVRECGILDTPDEESFNRLTRMTAILCGVPIAGISVIDDHRQWIKASYGPVGRETPREVSFCTYALLSDELFVVPDALEDDRFKANPFVQGPPYVRFYAGAPLISSVGYRLGAMFVLDMQPNTLTEINRRILTDFAAIAVDLIESKSKWL